MSIFNVFATQSRFLSSLQLRVIKELFHQSSFHWKNIVSSVQLLLKKSYLNFSLGEKVRGKCPRLTFPYILLKRALYCAIPSRVALRVLFRRGESCLSMKLVVVSWTVALSIPMGPIVEGQS